MVSMEAVSFNDPGSSSSDVESERTLINLYV